MLEEKKTKKIRLSSRFAKPHSSDEEKVSEILSTNYRRFIVKEKVKETCNSELTSILKSQKVIAMYELQTSMATCKVYALVCRSNRAPTELKDILKGTTVGIYGSFIESSDFDNRFLYVLINSKEADNLMFVHPDFYVNITFITDKTCCFRKYFLAQKYFGSGRISEELGSIGTMKHNIFENILLAETEIEDFDALIDRQIILEKEFFCQLNEKDMQHYRSLLKEMVNRTVSFKKRYIVEKKPIYGPNEDHITITQILASEYSLNSLKFSMKGKIDLLLKVMYVDPKNGVKGAEIIVPFELKTGKKYMEFEDQVMLYSICYYEDYLQGHFSLLYFSESDEFIWVQNNFEKLTHLARKRNEIALHLAAQQTPAPIENQFICNKFCSQNRNCVFETFLNRFESKLLPSKILDIEELRRDKLPVIEEHTLQTQHGQLTIAKLAYADHLLKTIRIEELAYLKDSNLEYNSTLSFVFANIYIMYQLHKQKVEGNRLMSFDLYFAFVDRPTVMEYLQGITINGDLIFVHKKNPDLKFEGKVKNLHIINSPKISVLKVTLKVKTTRSINKVFSLIENDPEFFIKYSTDWIINQNERTEYIKMRTNVVNCLTTIEDNDLMNLVIQASQSETKKLTLRNESEDFQFTEEPRGFLEEYQLSSFKLIPEQTIAIHRALGCKQFFQIQGFPGCGKTHVISVLLTLLLRQGKRILISCHTHKALNVVLQKLQENLKEEEHKKVLRMIADRENSGGDNFDVYASEKVKTLNDYHQFIDRSIFACTLLSIDRFKFKEKDFDFVIVDECSQILEPLLLKPLTLGKRFILIGDFLQFSPLMRAKIKEEDFDLGFSLFEKLCRRYPEQSITLTHQFRMNADIMHVANKYIYDGKMRAVTQEVLQQQLRLSYDQYNLLAPWLRDVLYPKNEAGVVFIDTSNLIPLNYCGFEKPTLRTCISSLSTENSNDIFNENSLNGLSEGGYYKDEHTAIEVIKSLLKGGISKQDIMAITSFNRQKECIMSSMPDFSNVTTIDRCQGVDSKVVVLVISVDRVSPRHIAGIIQRTNTAITRAREKLIVVGAISELKAYDRLYQLIKIISQKEWIVKVVKSEEEKFFEAIWEKNF